MTKEDAIYWLELLKTHSEKRGAQNITEALNMAVDALRKLNSSEKPNNCDTCRNKGFEGCEQPCLGCGCCGLYEPKDEPTRSKMEQVEDEPQTDCHWK